MDLLMQVNHMLVLDLLALAAILIALLTVLFVRLQRQQRVNTVLSAKLDQMVNEVLAIGDRSDYTVRSKVFK
jgi:hypothetical protein